MKLELTNGYRLHFEEFSRILGFLNTQTSRKIIPRIEIIQSLGMSIRQYESLSSIMVAFGLIKPATFVLTEFGKTVSNKDLFFEKTDTIWLLHYIASSNPKWIVWHRLITQVFPNNTTINSDISRKYFNDLSEKYSLMSLERKVPKEINAVLYAYTETHFLKLNYLSKTGLGQYRKEIPEKVTIYPFLFAILHFLEMQGIKQTAVTTEEIIESMTSPGAVFHLNKKMVIDLFHQLNESSFVNLETFGELYQLRFSEGLNKLTILNAIYS